MPILSQEIDLYPSDLLERPDLGAEQDRTWYALYTLSRHEKELSRRLLALEIPFYCPTIPQRQKSPSGRIRTAYLPLFSNYVFMYGDVDLRYKAFTTNCISRDLPVDDGRQLTQDLQQVFQLILTGEPLTRESRLQPGHRVRVRNGAFRGFEGYIIRREGQTRLLVAVNFLQQGASVLLDECEVEPL